MFTGIVRGLGKVVKILKEKKISQWEVETSNELVKNLMLGASISCNGCCLTVRNIFRTIFCVDIVEETLRSTSLNTIIVGQYINLERSIKFGEEVGGHLVSGHIITTGVVSDKKELFSNQELWISLSASFFIKYFFYKGFVCVDGISLTIGSIKNNAFCVFLIPETILRTTIGQKIIGDVVNIEIDFYTQITVDSVERLLKVHPSKFINCIDI
ncbi:riboflavin synthase alpha chain [Buchnera aphidicola str. Bp (Baizongia pistaciae)]|uniref:Riboflavin synthase n=1 Tax=Buchnera aphidicola subsp. Baizongia pistaciae (strain Bp) TaxID=224915 RepID=RISA_BUCBP|nr:riboflavin synthase subunit alpha [Buchnera aphidicola]Q89AX1.1 RecName: Full=Riboflavin synthase; Short=RS [Buchnera aphidicola str. Bp (Baizongia pistaciae)]AAO26841.1 riboflavin synthase alpha chain [Buchnera aphidicola str. Bp (Baizongia pistaciae)]